MNCFCGYLGGRDLWVVGLAIFRLMSLYFIKHLPVRFKLIELISSYIINIIHFVFSWIILSSIHFFIINNKTKSKLQKWKKTKKTNKKRNFLAEQVEEFAHNRLQSKNKSTTKSTTLFLEISMTPNQTVIPPSHVLITLLRTTRPQTHVNILR